MCANSSASLGNKECLKMYVNLVTKHLAFANISKQISSICVFIYTSPAPVSSPTLRFYKTWDLKKSGCNLAGIWAHWQYGQDLRQYSLQTWKGRKARKYRASNLHIYSIIVVHNDKCIHINVLILTKVWRTWISLVFLRLGILSWMLECPLVLHW